MAGKRGSKRRTPAERLAKDHLPTFIVANYPGREKFSDILKRFATPMLIEGPSNHEEISGIFTMCASAWNLAIFPPTDRASALKVLLRPIPFLLRRSMRKQLVALVERKLNLFDEYDWLFNDVKVIDTGTGYQLEVAVLLSAVPVNGV